MKRLLDLDAALLRLEVERIDWVVRRADAGAQASLEVLRTGCSWHKKVRE